MSAFEILAAAGLASAMLALGYVIAGSPKIGSAILAAALAAGFGAFTAVTIAREGVLLVWTNHTQNL